MSGVVVVVGAQTYQIARTTHGMAPDQAAFLLGILGLVVCQILGPFAWSMGNKALKEIDASGVVYSNRGSIQAGRICGIVASVLLVVTLVVVFLSILAVAFLGTKSSSNFDTVGESIVGLVAPFGV